MKEINKDMTIGDVLKIDEDLSNVFLGFNMHCLYCPISQMETLEEAAQVHGVDVELLVKKLNEAKNFKVGGKVKKAVKIKKAEKTPAKITKTKSPRKKASI